jgi:hypothetical protein
MVSALLKNRKGRAMTPLWLALLHAKDQNHNTELALSIPAANSLSNHRIIRSDYAV